MMHRTGTELTRIGVGRVDKVEKPLTALARQTVGLYDERPGWRELFEERDRARNLVLRVGRHHGLLAWLVERNREADGIVALSLLDTALVTASTTSGEILDMPFVLDYWSKTGEEWPLDARTGIIREVLERANVPDGATLVAGASDQYPLTNLGVEDILPDVLGTGTITLDPESDPLRLSRNEGLTLYIGQVGSGKLA